MQKWAGIAPTTNCIQLYSHPSFRRLEEGDWFNRYVKLMSHRSSSPISLPSHVPGTQKAATSILHRNHGNTSNELFLDARLFICLHVVLSIHALEACSVCNSIINLA